VFEENELKGEERVLHKIDRLAEVSVLEKEE